MPSARIPKDRQAVRFDSAAHRQEFTDWLLDEVRKAIDARARHIADRGFIDIYHELYEQAQSGKDAGPWADSADLASYIPTEKVDALRARLVQVIMGQDPVCTVEGWGEPAARVAKVEAFHQWKAEDERLQKYVTKTIHNALIEGNGILEVGERLALKKTRGPFAAKLKVDEFSRPVLSDQLQLQPDVDEHGALVPWSGREEDGKIEVMRESVDWLVRGPAYRIISLKDFLYLPAQAQDEGQIWGYAKRVHLRLSELKQRVDQGIYDADAVQALGAEGERDHRSEHTRDGISIAEQQGQTAEKELWEVHLLHDVDGDGIDEWLITCVSLRHSQLLRCAFDELEQVRYVDFCPFPKATSVYGYSFVGHKLWTIAAEHTALRNMKADRQALALMAPITRLTTSEWDPDDQPWGPHQILDVRTHEDIKQVQVNDVPASTIESERTILGAAERVSGLGDTAVSGIQADVKRTATEHSFAAQASFVRVDEAVKFCQASIADLYQLRHRLWYRALKADESGLAAPESVVKGLTIRGIELPTDGPFKFLASDLAGTFRFKPRGSVANADKKALRADLAEFVSSALPALLKLSPALAQQFMMNPDAAREILEQAFRLWDFPALQVLLRQQPGVDAPPGVIDQAPAVGGLPPGLLAALPGMAQQIGTQPPGV